MRRLNLSIKFFTLSLLCITTYAARASETPKEDGVEVVTFHFEDNEEPSELTDKPLTRAELLVEQSEVYIQTIRSVMAIVEGDRENGANPRDISYNALSLKSLYAVLEKHQ